MGRSPRIYSWRDKDDKITGWKKNIISQREAAADRGATSTVEDLCAFAGSSKGPTAVRKWTQQMSTPKSGGAEQLSYTWKYGYGNFFILRWVTRYNRPLGTRAGRMASVPLLPLPKQNLGVAIPAIELVGSLAWEVHDLISKCFRKAVLPVSHPVRAASNLWSKLVGRISGICFPARSTEDDVPS
jgi:hypothetical protein